MLDDTYFIVNAQSRRFRMNTVIVRVPVLIRDGVKCHPIIGTFLFLRGISYKYLERLCEYISH